VVTVSAFVRVHCVPRLALYDMPHAHRESHGKLSWVTVISRVPLMSHKGADFHYFRNHEQDGKVLHVEQEVLFFFNLIEMTKKMELCRTIYYSIVP
jgi:hypothetical protein